MRLGWRSTSLRFVFMGALLLGAVACGEDKCVNQSCLTAGEARVDTAVAGDAGVGSFVGTADSAQTLSLDGAMARDSGPMPGDSATVEDAPADLPLRGLVSVEQAVALIASNKIVLLDVRETFEFTGGYIEGALNLAWTSGALEAQWASLPTDKGILIYCRSGNRSSSAVAFLEQKGLDPLWDLAGGVTAWSAAGQPLVQ